LEDQKSGIVHDADAAAAAAVRSLNKYQHYFQRFEHCRAGIKHASTFLSQLATAVSAGAFSHAAAQHLCRLSKYFVMFISVLFCAAFCECFCDVYLCSLLCFS
jgi:hypothetical protein